MSEIELVVCPACRATNRVPVARLSAHPWCGKCRTPLFTGAPVMADTMSFDALVGKGTLPVLVDFWAQWCGPCRMMAPQFDAAAVSLEPRIRLAKVDIDRNPTLVQRYGVRSVPTIALFAEGKEVARRSGSIDRATLIDWTKGELAQR